jgi:hypothetical protein
VSHRSSISHSLEDDNEGQYLVCHRRFSKYLCAVVGDVNR